MCSFCCTFAPEMLEDYIIDNRIQYENHYLKIVDRDVQIGGVAGAALLCAMLVDTDEGTRRGIAIDSDAEQEAWIAVYEREVRRDGWGHINAELELLSNAYIEMATSATKWADLCPNVRLLDIAMQLIVRYMCRLTTEIFCNHIWECHPWKAPFAQWLYDAAFVETRRQRFLQMDWTDEALVTALHEDMTRAAESNEATDSPTFVFEGEAAEDIFKRYFNWVWTSYQAQLREQPGVQPRSVIHRNYVVEQETNWLFLAEEVQQLDEEQKQLWGQWMLAWQKYVTKQLKPEKPVVFWTPEVSDLRKRQLTQFLRIQEKEWDYFKRLSAAIYALRQLGYVRRACSVRDITRWMTEELVKDYTKKNNHDQFVRAWKELGRYSDEVEEFVETLNSYGITHNDNKKA